MVNEQAQNVQIAEQIQDGQDSNLQQGGNGNEPSQSRQYTQAEIEAMLKEAETKGFVKGKTDTTAKLEKKFAEQARLNKEEAEKQIRFEKMSELEKAQAKAKENEEELNKLKHQIALNEQKNETRKLMREKNLPDFMLDAILIFGDADATAQRIDEAKSIWDAEIQKAINEKIPTTVPKQNTNTNTNPQKSSFGDFDEEAARRLLNLKQRV